jgi:hypothetical protein
MGKLFLRKVKFYLRNVSTSGVEGKRKTAELMCDIFASPSASDDAAIEGIAGFLKGRSLDTDVYSKSRGQKTILFFCL